MQSLYVGGIMTNVELGKVCAQRTLKIQCLYVAGNLLKGGRCPAVIGKVNNAVFEYFWDYNIILISVCLWELAAYGKCP